jgi:hypothetical protein
LGILRSLLVRSGSCSFLVLGLFLRAPGCGSSDESTAAFGGPGASTNAPEDDTKLAGEGPTASASDAAAPMASFQGNPLCHVTTMSACTPDDDGTRKRTLACASPYDADAGVTTSKGCRLTSSGGSDVSPSCEAETSFAGTDGVTCSGGKDCAPGFDCVEGEKGQVCRRYCCADTCEGKASQSGGKTFCDVQKLVDVPVKAPVCMPLKACKLLTIGQCATSETCAIVTDTGETGCVEVGQAQVNDSCDTEHCAAGLTCIGQPGARKCYQLCKVGGSTCPSTLVCKTTTSFRDPAYGICQKPTAMD